MNWTKTFLLMGAMTALFVLIGNLVGGQSGMIFAFGLALVMNFFGYWYSDKIVLAMYGAKPITESDSPEIYRIVNKLTHQAGLTMPKLYVIDNRMPNAFATGRNPDNAAVAVTTGLLGILNSSEVEGVIAHELAHIKNRDILIGTIAATMAGAIMILANMARFAAFFGGQSNDEEGNNPIALLVVAILAPIAALLVQSAISRSREYQADMSGAEISGNPLGLANALIKLEHGNKALPIEASPATAHMFIVNPLKGGLESLFSTHPPIPDRVARLEAMAGYVHIR